MDSFDLAHNSESKSNESASFGLLDDKYFQSRSDASLCNESTSIKSSIQQIDSKKPPPIPNKSGKRATQQVGKELTLLDDTQNLEATVESIHLNESDLKDLEDEFTFEEEEEEEEEESEDHVSETKPISTMSQLQFNNLGARFDSLETSSSLFCNDLLVS